MYIGLWLLSAGHVNILLHPHCTPGPSPCIYKRKGQGLHTSGWSRGTPSLLANACNPYYKRTHSGAGQHEPQFSPLHVPSRANPSGLGHAVTILLVGPGTPRGRNADKHPNSKESLEGSKCFVSHWISTMWQLFALDLV
jgi:hypothetical protein